MLLFEKKNVLNQCFFKRILKKFEGFHKLPSSFKKKVPNIFIKTFTERNMSMQAAVSIIDRLFFMDATTKIVVSHCGKTMQFVCGYRNATLLLICVVLTAEA